MRPGISNSRRGGDGSALFAAMVLLGLIVVLSIGSAIALSHFQRNLSLLEQRQIKWWSGQKAQESRPAGEPPAAIPNQTTQAADE